MVDGSHLPFEENMALTSRVVKEAHARGVPVEAEIGRLSGTEDGLTVEEYEARLTSVDQVGQSYHFNLFFGAFTISASNQTILGECSLKLQWRRKITAHCAKILIELGL